MTDAIRKRCEAVAEKALPCNPHCSRWLADPDTGPGVDHKPNCPVWDRPAVADAMEQIVRPLVEGLRKRAHHLIVEGDPWYSCPKAGPENYLGPEASGPCNCGADEVIALLAQYLEPQPGEGKVKP